MASAIGADRLSVLVEKRREPVEETCNEPHPTLEWYTLDGAAGEYIVFAETCWLPKGHPGPHRCTTHVGGGNFCW